jgi:hypothetical protein
VRLLRVRKKTSLRGSPEFFGDASMIELIIWIARVFNWERRQLRNGGDDRVT